MSGPRTILIVDDEPGIVTVVRDYLDRAGFRVLTAGDGAAALRLARAERPNLLVLDLMLPGLEEADRLIGLELGADDYGIKPFSPRELVARVRAVLRRVEDHAPYRGVLQFDGLSIDLERRM